MAGTSGCTVGSPHTKAKDQMDMEAKLPLMPSGSLSETELSHVDSIERESLCCYSAWYLFWASGSSFKC